MNSETKNSAPNNESAETTADKNSNQPRTKNFRPYLIAASAVGLIAAVLQIIIYRAYYETDMMLYKSDVPLVNLFHAILFVCALAALTALYTSKNAELSDISHTSRFTEFASLFTAFVLLLYTVLGVIGILRGYDILNIYSDLFRILLPIAALLGSVFFLGQVFLKSKDEFDEVKNIGTTAFFGIFLLVYLIIELLNLYYDKTSPINEPSKVLRQLSVMASMLYILYEIKFKLEPKKTGLITASMTAALIFLPLSCISMLISMFTGVLPLTAGNVISYAIDLGLYLYILSRAFAFLHNK